MIYLAQFELVTKRYMAEKEERKPMLRLVEAPNPAIAEFKLLEYYEYYKYGGDLASSRHGMDSRTIENLVLSETLT